MIGNSSFGNSRFSASIGRIFGTTDSPARGSTFGGGKRLFRQPGGSARRRRQPRLELLEQRELLTTWQIPAGNAANAAIVTDVLSAHAGDTFVLQGDFTLTLPNGLSIPPRIPLGRLPVVPSTSTWILR